MAEAQHTHPVLLVHGIWNTADNFRRMRSYLERRGLGPVVTVDLRPNWGLGTIERLAHHIELSANRLRDEWQAPRFDLVGFSMGALVSRYWLQRLQGKARVRRFISICGPHNGSLPAFAIPLPGVKQMRPNSDFLTDLASDPDPFGEVEVHTLWTPFDLTVFPGHSARLPEAHQEHRLAVPMHRFMLTHPKALQRVGDILAAPSR